MALTSNDETDLILPLYAGVHEEPRFASFLETLRRRTRAEAVSLILRRGAEPAAEVTSYFAGRDLRREAEALGGYELGVLDQVNYDRLRPGRVYSPAEFVEDDPTYKAEREKHVARLGVADERIVRLPQTEGLDAWLILARDKACTAADSALLSNLAPYVALALRNLVLIERQRFESEMGAAGLARSGTGWIAFDGAAHVVAFDPATGQHLQTATGAAPARGQRLRNLSLHAERELAVAAAEFAANPNAAKRPVLLSESPRIEALLVPARMGPSASIGMTAIAALCRLPKQSSQERAFSLARLFDLPLREAQLAVGLSDGLSLAEAGEALGLTLETTRNYSKRLYAKLGLRGQAELVRLVYESSASLA